LKLDQAQYRELEAFAKFGSDLDDVTKFVLERGKRNVEILKQKQNEPMSVEKQVAIIYCGTKGLLAKVPVQDIKKAEEELLMILQNSHSGVLKDLKAGKIDDAITSVIEKVAADICAKY